VTLVLSIWNLGDCSVSMNLFIAIRCHIRYASLTFKTCACGFICCTYSEIFVAISAPSQVITRSQYFPWVFICLQISLTFL
jgi:hypothetical protein